jgi:site-specific DNA-methyltransferase (adenine-specific)
MAAIMKAGILEIPVRTYPAELTELEMRSIELMENLARKDLDWVEGAKLKAEIHRLQVAIKGAKISTSPDAPGQRLQDTADLLGVSVAKLHSDIALVDAMEVFPELADAKGITEANKKLTQLKTGLIKEELAKRLDAQLATTPVDRIRANLCQRYILGNCLEVMANIPDNSMDFCEVDPPYGIDIKRLKENHDDNYQKASYNEIPADEYLPFMKQVLTHCHRILVDNAWIALWFGPDPWHEPMYQLLNEAGFKTSRITAMWYKGSVGQTLQPETNLANCYESFYYARKGNPSILRQGRSNVWHYKAVPPDKKIHPTERPIEMIQDVLQTFCWEGSRIFVPFSGSGNTLLAAANLGMTGIGTDLTKEYKDAYTVRVHESVPMKYTSYKNKEE